MKLWHTLSALLLFVALPIGIIGYKMAVLGYSMDHVVPWKGYAVSLEMTWDGHGDSVEIATFLPLAEKRQHFWNEAVNGGSPSQKVSLDSAGNRVLRINAGGKQGLQKALVEFRALGERTRYDLEANVALESTIPPEAEMSLGTTGMIQSADPEIIALRKRIAPDGFKALPALKAIFAFASDSIAYKGFSGGTDALTALRLGEASCNGKSRLMAALLRSAGIPARLVGGLILEKGTKRTSHQWLEAYVAGFWIPFCPTNRHFAEIPENYLALYHGDEVLFRHSPNINFKYAFTASPILVGKDEIGLGREQLGSIMGIWEVFNRVGLSLSVLKVLLLVPIGGFITVIFRNIIGLEPFGTFLPTLIASAAQETGLLWGILSFFLVIGICAVVRALFEGFKITRTPKLAIIMIFVVASMLSLTYLGLTLNMRHLVFVSLFPVVVLTMTVERFSRTVVEEGLPAAFSRSLVTGLAIFCCYAVISLKSLTLILMTFPEALLLLVAMNLWVGRWAGVRVTEYWRFRHLLLAGPSSPASTSIPPKGIAP
jgi:hypothetical protein